MRILFTPLAERPHLYPMVPLAWACSAAGHEVRVAGQPVIRDAITRSGLSAVSVDGSYDYTKGLENLLGSRQFAGFSRARGALSSLANSQDSASSELEEARMRLPEQQRRQLLDMIFGPWVQMAEAMAEDLIYFVRQWRPDLIVTDPVIFAAPLAAEAVGVPLVRHLWGPDMTRQMRFPAQGAVEGAGTARERWQPAWLSSMTGSTSLFATSTPSASSILAPPACR